MHLLPCELQSHNNGDMGQYIRNGNVNKERNNNKQGQYIK